MAIFWNDGTSLYQNDSSGWTSGDELYHWGIPGMKWGQRRWQNADGSFNEEGKIRYGRVSLSERRKAKFQNPDGSYTEKGKNKNRRDFVQSKGKSAWYYPDGNYEKYSQVLKEIKSSTDAKAYSKNLSIMSDANDNMERLQDKYSDKADKDCREDWNRQVREFGEANVMNFDEYAMNYFIDYYRPYIEKDTEYNKYAKTFDKALNDNQKIVKKITNDYYGQSDDKTQKQIENYISNMLRYH